MMRPKYRVSQQLQVKQPIKSESSQHAPIQRRYSLYQEVREKFLMEKQQINKLPMEQNSKLKSQNKSLKELIDQLKQKNSNLLELSQKQQAKIEQYKHQNTSLQIQVDELNTIMKTKQKEFSQAKQLVYQYKQVLRNVSIALQKKLNRKVPKPEEFAKEIENYSTPVGTKLITSHIIHGYDQQRSQIVASIQKFNKQQICRTDLLVRFPESKTILHAFPKDKKQFAFIVLYKTTQGTIFGSFSEGMRKPTFIFSFSLYEEKEQNKPSDVKFFIPQESCQNNNSIHIFDRYLKYGSEELKLNCLEPSKICVSSEMKEEDYYRLNWEEVMNQNEKGSVALSELEVHIVEFKE